MPGADAKVPVEAAGGVVVDLDGPGLAALAVGGDPRRHRSTSLRHGSLGSYRMAASSDRRIPVARNTAITAASRHCWNDRPAQARSSRSSSPPAKTGTGLSVMCGGLSPAIGQDLHVNAYRSISGRRYSVKSPSRCFHRRATSGSIQLMLSVEAPRVRRPCGQKASPSAMRRTVLLTSSTRPGDSPGRRAD
jgi:hypothetical protein